MSNDLGNFNKIKYTTNVNNTYKREIDENYKYIETVK